MKRKITIIAMQSVSISLSRVPVVAALLAPRF
jgi:hypothetical protein